MLTVFDYSYSKKYYITHPHKWVKEFFINLRNAWDRATKGYCYMDWANFDSWFKEIAPLMLKDIADKGCGYPGIEPFDEPEKWHDWLHEMADKIEACQEDRNENEYLKDFKEACDIIRVKSISENGDVTYSYTLEGKDKEIRDKYFNREVEMAAERKAKFKEVMTELLEHWDRLWD